MSDVSDILAKKGCGVVCVEPDTTVLEATQVMNSHRIGALVVMDGGRVVGIFTERDVLRRVVAEERNPSITKVDDVMTTDIACARRETALEEAAGVMKNRRVRHLPVCDAQGHLEGMISIGDLNAWRADGAENTVHFLSEYIHGRA